MKRYLLVLIAAIIAVGTVAFTHHPEKERFVIHYFALNTGASVGSTNPADYHAISDPGCDKQKTFCAITQMDNPTLSIPSTGNLHDDLVNLSSNPNGNFNTSKQIIYQFPK